MKGLRGALFAAAGMGAAMAAGWIGFPALLYESHAQPLAFSHAVHTGEGAGMACEDCHVIEEAGRFAGIPPVETCAACHEEPLGESEAEKELVESHVARGREIPWLVYARQPDNVRFSHAVHVRLGGLGCEDCHADHGSTAALRPFEANRITGYSRDLWGPTMVRASWRPGLGMKMDDCSGCHRARGVAESCLDCHR